jgi:heme-degrading monooxygenase HmoA
MILEIASFDIRPEAAVEFEAAYAEATHVIARAGGHLGHEMHRSVDTPGRYVLTVRWRTREDHVLGFRGSVLFTQWRALLQPHFATAPVVDHLELIQEVPPP